MSSYVYQIEFLQGHGETGHKEEFGSPISLKQGDTNSSFQIMPTV